MRRLDYTATHRLVAHVARALTRAHAVGIVHRDLKPENIYLIPDDDGEMAKVLDFGVAKYSTDWAVNSVTKTGLLVGTPLYMSPEQARGTKELDHRADLWSLAVIAYQCLTGELPFVSEGLGDLLAKIMFEPIPVPSHIVPTLPPAFDAWWARASSRDIHVRFTSAKEIADTLGVALGLSTSVTVAAAPPGFREKTMSDYSLSVSDSAGPVSERGGIAKFWPRGQTGRLLGLGVVGVIAIAGTMSWKSARDKRSSETLVTPSAPVSAASASPDLLPPVNPVIAPGGENPDSEPAKMAEPAIEPPPAARPAPKEPSRSSPSKRAVPAPAAPAKPKRVDFGI